MKKSLKLLIIPALFLSFVAFTPLVHADEDSTTTPPVMQQAVGHGSGGSSVMPTSAAQKREVLEYRLSLLLQEWHHIFGVDYPNMK